MLLSSMAWTSHCSYQREVEGGSIDSVNRRQFRVRGLKSRLERVQGLEEERWERKRQGVQGGNKHIIAASGRLSQKTPVNSLSSRQLLQSQGVDTRERETSLVCNQRDGEIEW